MGFFFDVSEPDRYGKTTRTPRMGRIIGTATTALFLLMSAFGSFYVVDPGTRGIVITMGKVSAQASGEGLGFKTPWISSVVHVSVRQRTEELKAPAFSSDMQQVNTTVQVLYRIPEASVVEIYQKYAGSPFDSLIAPRVQEALKEVTSTESAEGIVKKRETIKLKTLEAARAKIGTILVIEDIVIEDVALSKELENAIEQKMVQEQEAAKAKFTKEKATIDAQTAIIRAEGEAQAIRKRGDAIRQNPGVVELMIAEKWNGVSPLVVGEGKGSNILLPISKKNE